MTSCCVGSWPEELTNVDCLIPFVTCCLAFSRLYQLEDMCIVNVEKEGGEIIDTVGDV